jgi:dTDP-4-dehydrorhamnose reductase
MIRGRGLLAKALTGIDSDKYFFYVNGISNSVVTFITEDNFEASELAEISKSVGNKIFVYFSTSQVNVKENYVRSYVQHKYKMECRTKELFPNYLIVRTSNLVGNNPWNTHTLFNFLYNSLKERTEIYVTESVIRNILDIDDFIKLFEYYLTHFPHENTTVDIVNPISYNMAEILYEFERIFSTKFIKRPSEDNIAYFQAPVEFSLSLSKKCNISLDNYLPVILKKYYPAISV